MTDRLPLNALQAFERAARSGSFAAAAQALGVTPAAISQHVRLLEDHFGRQLFHRRANGVELTDAGRDLFLPVAGAFAALSEAAGRLRSAVERPRAVISVLSSVNELWLMPALAGLAPPAGAAGLRIIEEERDPVDFAAAGLDIRITYGAAAYPNQKVVALFRDRLLPVAAPDLAADLPGGAAAAPDARLIHTEWGPAYASPQSWAGWLAATGSERRPDPGRGLTVDRLAAAAAAARQGLGVALLPATLAAADLAAGRLRAVGPAAAFMPEPYVMVARPATRHRPGAAPVWRHLLARAGVTEAGEGPAGEGPAGGAGR
ncbi:MAG: LysR family transcriptional regulator [Rhodobacteraceae bacterium]|nr:LysR family transcriptional regulator [Paracoccaceae bacterium]